MSLTTLVKPMATRYAINATTPTDLWVKLGKLFFHNDWDIDIQLADRRFIVLAPRMYISDWPVGWTGQGLMRLVGYSTKGSKMTILRKKYVNEEALEAMKEILREQKEKNNKKFFATGMNFNMGPWRKGGCLASFHVLRIEKQWLIVIHGKIAEIPRKFVADLVLVSDIIRELQLEGTIGVQFQYSSMFYSIIGLRAYVPVLGRKQMDYRDLPIEEARNYQMNSWKAIEGYWKDLQKEYGKGVLDRGMSNYICTQTGRLKRRGK